MSAIFNNMSLNELLKHCMCSNQPDLAAMQAFIKKMDYYARQSTVSLERCFDGNGEYQALELEYESVRIDRDDLQEEVDQKDLEIARLQDTIARLRAITNETSNRS
jgi:SMC interacting uncharacterized protein involved in chromosome segregation